MELETQTKTPPQNPPPAIPEQGSELEVIRTETVFSRLPMHILSKSGRRPSINIEKRGAEGKLQERWKVTYNEEYGPARQLAFDIHTLIVEPAIEQAFEEARRTGQPLPKLIPLQSLTEIANNLGGETKDTNRIKKALFQNAGILITAFKKFRASDGSERTIEGVFSPYGVFLFGEKLPDGRTSDGVYANLNDPYYTAWSASPNRPLDHTYERELAPTPRRFYRLVSFAVYGSLNNGHSVAAYKYSDYCDRAPQLRYFTFDQVKKQMYKIHRPHLKSGYLEGVEYQATIDEQGRADWVMLYTLGPKARSDYVILSGGKKLPRTIDAAAKHPTGESGHHRPRQRRLNLKPAPEQQTTTTPASAVVIDYRHVATMSKHGISEADARKVLSNLPADYPTADVLEYLDTEITRPGSSIKSPPGFIVDQLQRRARPPATFVSSAVRKEQDEAFKAQQQARAETDRQRQQQEAAEAARADAQLDQLARDNPARWQQLFAQAKVELIRLYPSMAELLARRDGNAIHEGAIRASMKKLILDESQKEVFFPPSIEESHQTTNKAPRQADRLQAVPMSAPPDFAANLQAVLIRPQLKGAIQLGPATPADPQS